MATRREKIIAKAIEILKSSPDGIRYSDLVRNISQKFPEIPVKTIYGTVWNLETRTNEVYKPARGWFRHIEFKEEEISEEERKIQPEIEEIKEEDFYEPFANWLVNELEECTKAIPLGGNRFRE